MLEIVKDPKYYYTCGLGSKYDHLTDGGKVKLAETVELFAPQMLQLERQALEELAKELVVKELQK
jgi:hypothetical protein